MIKFFALPLTSLSLIEHKFIFSDYKKWYLEDGAPVVPPKTDQDVDLLSDPEREPEVRSLTDDDSKGRD